MRVLVLQVRQIVVTENSIISLKTEVGNHLHLGRRYKHLYSLLSFESLKAV